MTRAAPPKAPYLVGIDTGGTYTDAVLFDEARGVLAKAKALTTRDDLARGIGAALDAVARGVGPEEIGSVMLSTTLATNAIVEGLGGRVCLVAIGFAPDDLDRAGLREAVQGDVLLTLPGGHDSFGSEQVPLDLAPLEAWIAAHPGAVGAFAVAARFSIANPDHEDRARAAIEAATGAPVTCSHDLTARLNGPKRALTAVLNARLVPVIHRLVEGAAGLLAVRGIRAPLMIVKGDGSLLSVAEARRRPIETILSGPAASIAGAAYLTGATNAMVSDIGGTTTDIGILRDGLPRLDPEGATVAGLSTFVEAVAMHTFGLGSDSEVRADPAGSPWPLALGPRRAVPVSLLAATHGAQIHAALEAELAQATPAETAGRFAVRTGLGGDTAGRAPLEAELLAALAAGPRPLGQLLVSVRQRSAFARLVGRGEVMVSAFSPSDAAHVLGLHRAWDGKAAEKAATLFARQRGSGGAPLAPDAQAMSRMVVDTLVRSSAERLLDVALGQDGVPGERPSRHPLLRAALSGRSGLARISARLEVPLVGLGASAPTYYPDVARMLGAAVIVPDHADVANAVGAVVGRVRAEVLVVVSRPDDGRFRVHGAGGARPRDFHDEGAALAFAEAAARDAAAARARASGAADVAVQIARDAVSAVVADRDFVLEWRFTAVAVGRPRFPSPGDERRGLEPGRA